jgi:tellurite resistance protein
METHASEHAGFHLSKKQVAVFAAGLYHLAACDGVSEEETAIIREFLSDAGARDLVDQLESMSFDPVSAYEVLETSWLRRLFLRAALLVIRSDGKVTDQEQEAIEWMAGAFGVEGGYVALSAELEGAES